MPEDSLSHSASVRYLSAAAVSLVGAHWSRFMPDKRLIITSTTLSLIIDCGLTMLEKIQAKVEKVILVPNTCTLCKNQTMQSK